MICSMPLFGTRRFNFLNLLQKGYILNCKKKKNHKNQNTKVKQCSKIQQVLQFFSLPYMKILCSQFKEQVPFCPSGYCHNLILYFSQISRIFFKEAILFPLSISQFCNSSSSWRMTIVLFNSRFQIGFSHYIKHRKPFLLIQKDIPVSSNVNLRKKGNDSVWFSELL